MRAKAKKWGDSLSEGKYRCAGGGCDYSGVNSVARLLSGNYSGSTVAASLSQDAMWLFPQERATSVESNEAMETVEPL